jgi:PEP-CTERM motif
VKKFAVIALSLGLLGALPTVQATPVSVDAGTFTFTYDDSFLAGSTFSTNGGLFTFSNLLYAAVAASPDVPVAAAGDNFNGWNGGIYPIVLTPKAGYQITGLTESASGAYLAVGGEGSAGVGGGFISNWLLLDGVYSLGQNVQGAGVMVTAGQVDSKPSFTVGGSLDFAQVMAAQNLQPGSVVLSSIDFSIYAAADGQGAAAGGWIKQYQLGITTAAVPEPETLGLLLAGLGVVGFKLGRRKQR